MLAALAKLLGLIVLTQWRDGIEPSAWLSQKLRVAAGELRGHLTGGCRHLAQEGRVSAGGLLAHAEHRAGREENLAL